jgi:hypothetical protein
MQWNPVRFNERAAASTASTLLAFNVPVAGPVFLITIRGNIICEAFSKWHPC